MERNRKDTKRKQRITDGIFLFVTVLGMFFFYTSGRIEQRLMLKLDVLLVLFHSVFLSVLQFICREKGNRGISLKRVYYICFLFSLLGMYVSGDPLNLPFWMLGGWMLSVFLNYSIGCTYQTMMCLVFGIMKIESMEMFAYLYLAAVGMCLLTPYLKKLSNIGYVILIGTIGNAILIILKCNFIWKNMCTKENIICELVFFLNILLCALGAWVLQGYLHTGDFRFIKSGISQFLAEEEEMWEEGTFMKLGDIQVKGNGQADLSYTKFLQKDFSLYRRLEQEQPVVYRHSRKVAELSKEAAEVLDLDAMLAYLGGFYHEIGRLEGEDYIASGCRLAKEFKLPNEVEAIILEHNVSVGLPKSKEAAIVMLADSIVFMMERAKNISSDEEKMKMIKKLFHLRVEKDALSMCDMTFREYKLLEEYFEKWALRQEWRESV